MTCYEYNHIETFFFNVLEIFREYQVVASTLDLNQFNCFRIKELHLHSNFDYYLKIYKFILFIIQFFNQNLH